MTQHRALCLGAIWASLLLGSPAADAQATADEADMLEQAARWNDRSTPRKTLETFYYAIYAYDLAPELIVNAIDCLEVDDEARQFRDRDAALMCIELNSILSQRSDLPLYGTPDGAGVDRITLVDDDETVIAMARQADGSWRFTRDTVDRIPRMRAHAATQQRALQESRARMAEGRTDPEATLRTFLYAALIRQDYAAAAQCLDLRDVPAKLRATHGPEQARKLLFVMLRCGFAFAQEFPSDPNGWRYTWHSNHHGRILVDRVRTPEGKEAWLFGRVTLMNLDALVEGFRQVPPDPRYGLFGKLVDERVLVSRLGRVPAPQGVPAGLGSPRATLRTFCDAIDAMEFDDNQASVVLGCLDLGELPEADRPSLGLRLATKLHAILRLSKLDILSFPDSWQAETQRLAPEADTSLTLSRQSDGAWRFDRQSVSSIAELFDRLDPKDKAALEHRSPFSSARQTMRSLLTAVERKDAALAAECLDLGEIPAGARKELGRGLAFKLWYVLNHLGRVVVHEIPDEPIGPRYYAYRGSLGRISMDRDTDPARPDDWQFTRETVHRIDGMFQAALLCRDGATPIPLPLALRIRAAMPAGLAAEWIGLAAYQWIGLAGLALASAAIGWGIVKAARLVVGHLLQRYGEQSNLSIDFVLKKLAPLGFQAIISLVYWQLPLLDLPIGVVGLALPTFKFVSIGLIGWSILCLLDLAMAFYTNSEHVRVRNNLNDMIVPTVARSLKLIALVAAVCCQVALIGNGEWLTKLLAGLGLVGLAASLAAQDTLKNVFGTLLLIGEHPFRIGDVIVVNGLEGTVESVGFRSTRIRTPEESLMTIPNSVIAATSIDNRGMRKSRRFRGIVALPYDTPIDRLIALRDAIREAAVGRPELIRADKVDVHIHTLGGSSIDLLVNLYFWVETFRDEMEARDWLNREILNLADRLGVTIAFPTQTIHLADREGSEPKPADKTQIQGVESRLVHTGHTHFSRPG